MQKMLQLLAAAACAFGLVPAYAQVSDDTVRIGVMNDLTGPYSEISGPGSVTAAKMAVEDFQKMKHPAYRIEVVVASHQNKPDVGSVVARKWYDTDGVDMIVDVPVSSVALAVNQVAKEKKKVFINTGAGSPDLTGTACTPTTVHWLFDTWMLANSTGRAVVHNGGDTWFFLTADYAFGHALEADTSKVVVSAGGKVLGSVKVPMNTSDFSSYLVRAKASGAKIIGLANAGNDTTNAIKQAAEFGLVQGGQKLAGLLVFLPDVQGLGLKKAQGLNITEAFYWDLNDETRAWSKRFAKLQGGKYPSADHAGVYSAVLHYLKAVDAAGTDDGIKVVAKMKELPTDDPLFGKGVVRADGRKIHAVHLFEVKSPAESTGPYDFYKRIASIDGNEAFRPINQGGCSLLSPK
ncbi:ABC transporter substrate-binding protein [Comamonas odontotermitis]|uniref:ABC transporter substrate-binding protein n=1 Tax=Comamonas odontotermitis TaxID=379895 RepID=UPI0037538FD2